MELNSSLNNHIDVSVIIPIYNSEKYLSTCLDSILSQDSEHLEVICVDDGSSDSSFSIMSSYKDRFYNLVIIFQHNKGLSSARNTGLKIASGKYVFFIDSDDIVKAGFIKRAYTICLENNLDLFLFSFQNFTNDKAMTIRYGKRLNTIKRKWSSTCVTDGIEMMRNLIAHNEYYNMVWIQMIRKEFLDQTGIRFKEGIVFEDVVYTYKVFLNSSRVMCTNEVGYFKRLHSESICGKPENIFNVQSMLDNVVTIHCINEELFPKTDNSYDDIKQFIEEKTINQLNLHFNRLPEELQKKLNFNNYYGYQFRVCDEEISIF